MLTAQHAIGSFSKGGFGVTRLLSMVQQLQIYDLSERRCLMSNPHALRHETYLESPGLYYMIMERPALQMRTVFFVFFFEKFLQRMREDLLSGSLKEPCLCLAHTTRIFSDSSLSFTLSYGIPNNNHRGCR